MARKVSADIAIRTISARSFPRNACQALKYFSPFAIKGWPNYDVYQSRTERQIPVVVLDPVRKL